MDKDFVSSLEFLMTDVAWRISTTDVMVEFEEHFCHPTQVVARDAMDILCAKEGLEGRRGKLKSSEISVRSIFIRFI